MTFSLVGWCLSDEKLSGNLTALHKAYHFRRIILMQLNTQLLLNIVKRHLKLTAISRNATIMQSTNCLTKLLVISRSISLKLHVRILWSKIWTVTWAYFAVNFILKKKLYLICILPPYSYQLFKKSVSVFAILYQRTNKPTKAHF